MKGFQRFFAILLLFGIWIVVFYVTQSLKQSNPLRQITVPNQTMGVLKINPRVLFSDILFDFSFKNTDPKILKIVGEYYRNAQQDTSKTKQKIDFKKNIALIKIKINQQIVWMIAGSYIRNNHQIKNGLVHNGVYYECIEPFYSLSQREFKNLFKKGNTFRINLNENPLEYALYEDNKEKVSYKIDLNDRNLNIKYTNHSEFLCLKTMDNNPCFHLSSTLNKGSLLPKNYANLKSLTDNLKSFSINYYGASFNEKEEGSSFDANFDLLLNFSSEITDHKLEEILKDLTGGAANVHNHTLTLYNSEYLIQEINNSCIYIGQHQPKIYKSNIPFKMSGNPALLTEIKNLGWKGGLLEMIPEYRALKDFSNSVEKIEDKSINDKHTISVKFKEGKNARLEVFRVLLTMANAYQFAN